MIFAKLLLPVGLAFIMFAIGLTLRWSDFARVAKQPLAIGAGLFCQLLLLPIVAFSLLHFFKLDPMLAIGVMILAASPGGITSNLLTHLAKGDTALSISLTAISSLAGVITIPLIVGYSFTWFQQSSTVVDLPVWRLIIGIFIISTLPVIIGLLINQTNPKLAAKIEQKIRPLSVVIFAGIVLSAFYSEWGAMVSNLPMIGGIMVALNLTIMITGFFLAKFLGVTLQAAKAISLEGGLQNGAMGIFVATTLAQNSALLIPSITYALIMNISAFVFIAAVLFKPSPSVNSQ